MNYKKLIPLTIIWVIVLFIIVDTIRVVPKTHKAIITNVIADSIYEDSGIVVLNIFDEHINLYPKQLSIEHCSFYAQSIEGLTYNVNINAALELQDVVKFTYEFHPKDSIENNIINIINEATKEVFEDYLVYEIKRDSMFNVKVKHNIANSLSSIGYRIKEINIDYSLDIK